MSTAAPPLLTAETLARLERLDLVSRKIFRGPLQGDRRSSRKGRSVEFADFRGYAQGDDLRFVDWNIAARLNRLFVKLFHEEEELQLWLLVDNSRSMTFGEPTKLHVAKQLAAALGFIGLIRAHRVGLQTLGPDNRSPSRVWRGRHNAWQMFRHLEAFAGDDHDSIAAGVRRFTSRNARRGIVVVIGDLMEKDGFEASLRPFAGRPFDLYVVHLLSREEIKPDVAGDLRLIDSEDGVATEITVGEPLLQAYDRAVQSFRSEVAAYCTRRGWAYLPIDNQLPVEQIVLELLARQGLVG